MGKTETCPCHTACASSEGVVAKLLIDECLHTSLLELAHAAGYIADLVTYLGLGSSKDWELVSRRSGKAMVDGEIGLRVG